jgi:protein-tyrosine phosphatase
MRSHLATAPELRTDHPPNRGTGPVLVVCTANVCRSPVAARLLADALGPDVEVRSAGTEATPGALACPEATAWVETQFGTGRRRRTPPPHRATLLDSGLIRSAALVLTATRAHRAAVIRLAPAAQANTFSLAQAARLARWATAQPADLLTPLDGRVEPAAWLAARLASGRGRVTLPERDDLDDISDPHLDGARHDDAFAQIQRAVETLATLLAAGTRASGRITVC